MNDMIEWLEQQERAYRLYAAFAGTDATPTGDFITKFNEYHAGRQAAYTTVADDIRAKIIELQDIGTWMVS